MDSMRVSGMSVKAGDGDCGLHDSGETVSLPSVCDVLVGDVGDCGEWRAWTCL